MNFNEMLENSMRWLSKTYSPEIVKDILRETFKRMRRNRKLEANRAYRDRVMMRWIQMLKTQAINKFKAKEDKSADQLGKGFAIALSMSMDNEYKHIRRFIF